MPANFQCFTDVDDRHHEAVLNQGDHSRRNVKRFAFVVFMFVRNRRMDKQEALPPKPKPFEGFLQIHGR